MESEKVKEIKKALKFCCGECDCDCPFYNNEKSYEECKSLLLFEALTLINELESENESLQDLCNKTYENLTKEIDRLENRVKELEEGIAKSMLGCEFLPECTKEIAEKIWNMSKITVDATKHIVQGREYLHLDALKEIVKACGVEIKE